ncbi:MAG TPA: NAD-dependent epimerase/dehydratase family protein, partial [Chloroflexi bacterium]|nr:NAD-dependent epimerase/dehydratase family protein [Chloroflexota bacterium]
MDRYLVTGTAGFIASVVSQKLLESGAEIVGIDNMNDAYDVRMKEYRLEKLRENPDFKFLELDVSDRSILDNDQLKGQDFSAVINLAARAGVRD